MKRRHLEYAVVAGMLVTGTYVLVSGLRAGYTCAALVLVHLALNRRRVTNYLRALRRRPHRPAAPPVTPRAEVWPRLGRRGFLIGALAGLGGFLLGRFFPDCRPPAAGDLGWQYHRWSMPGGSGADGLRLDWGPRPSSVKVYPQAPPSPCLRPVGHRRTYGRSLPPAAPVGSTALAPFRWRSFLPCFTPLRASRSPDGSSGPLPPPVLCIP